MINKLISIVLSAGLAFSMTACGNSGSGEPTEKDFEKAAEKLDSMTEEDFEKEVEKKAEKLDNMTEEDLEKALEGVDGGEETTSSSAEKKEGYEPCQEILDADFTSGLIQIGNDVFKCGGYLTVSDLVEQYGDRYDFDVDLNKELADDETEGKFTFVHKTNGIKINALYCKHGKTLGEAVAYDFEEPFYDRRKNTFFPKGVKGTESLDSKNALKERATNIFNTYFNTNNILETRNIEEAEHPNPDKFWHLDSIKKYSGYNEKNNVLHCSYTTTTRITDFFGSMFTLDSDNLFGFKPNISFVIKFDSSIDLQTVLDYAQYNLYDEITMYPTKPHLE